MTPPVSASIAPAVTPNYPSVDPKNLEAWVEERLRLHEEALATVTRAPERTLETTLRAYDDALALLGLAGAQTGLMHSIYPNKEVRDTAEALLQKISQAGVELSLNREVYQALAAIDASGADAATKHYLDRTLLQYRLAGVDKDDATRARIKELQDQGTLLCLTFARNVQEGGN
ncbi:MAG: peptidase M3, partial [Acidobacteriaceae bacterium]